MLRRRALLLIVALVATSLLSTVPAAAEPLGPAATGRVNVLATFRGQPVGQLAVLINNSATNPNQVNNFDGTNFTGADGRYSFDVPAGNFDVHVAEWPVNNATYGSQVIYEIPVPDGGAVDLAFELDQPAGAMTGVVTGPDGSPAAGVQVDAFGSSAAGDGAPFGWGSTQTAADGTYTINRLRPNGHYVVFAPGLGYRVEGVPVQAGLRTTGANLPSLGALGFVADPSLPIGTPAGSLPTLSGHVPVVGDWNGNGQTTLGVRAGIHFLLLNSIRDAADADIAAAFGAPEHLPLAGDWDGDGTDTIGVWGGGWFLLSNENASGADADIAAVFGDPDMIPLVGDWDGDGRDTIGVWKNGTFLLSNGTTTTNVADIVVEFGGPSGVPLVGDWDGDGIDTVGTWLNGTFSLRNSNTPGPADLVTRFGEATDVPLVGDWDGNGTDTVGLRRGGHFIVSNVNTDPGRVDAYVAYGAPTVVRR